MSPFWILSELGGEWWQLELYKMNKAPVKLSPPRNQHPVLLQAGYSSCRPTNSVGEMKAEYYITAQPEREKHDSTCPTSVLASTNSFDRRWSFPSPSLSAALTHVPRVATLVGTRSVFSAFDFDTAERRSGFYAKHIKHRNIHIARSYAAYWKPKIPNSFRYIIHNTVISAHCSDSFPPLSFPRLLVNLLIQFLTLYFIMILSFLFFCKLSNHLSINHLSTDWLIEMWNLYSLMIARTVRSLLHIVRPRCLH